MKIAYFVTHDITNNDGITKKFVGQTEEWIKDGNEVHVFCLSPNLGESILKNVTIYKQENPFKTRLFLQKKMYNDILEFQPDIVYFRYNTWSVTLSKLLSNYKVITELNTLDVKEFRALIMKQKSFISIVRYLSYMLLRPLVLSKVSGIVGVTNEIIEDASNSKFKKPSIAIANGINLDKYPTIKKPIDIAKVKLFFIGSPGAPWHGVDIIEKMAQEMTEYEFHIVGMDGKNTDNMIWHGYLDRSQYSEILKQCQICISSLALFRNGMKEACPLKTREYLAYGYPIILGYLDTAFINNGFPEWSFYIDSEKSIDFGNIKMFIESNKMKIINHNEIQYISTSNLEIERLAFFNKIVSN